MLDCGGILAFIVAIALVVAAAGELSAGEFTVDKTDDGLVVKLDGQLFTKYLTQSGKKPILWPIIGPTGKAMTRAWPMDTSEVDAAVAASGKKLTKTDVLSDDHPWHRSLWFSYQSVDGANLWEERENTGSTKHREFVSFSGGPQAKIVTRNDWLDKDGKKLLEDERTITCSTDGRSTNHRFRHCAQGNRRRRCFWRCQRRPLWNASARHHAS